MSDVFSWEVRSMGSERRRVAATCSRWDVPVVATVDAAEIPAVEVIAPVQRPTATWTCSKQKLSGRHRPQSEMFSSEVDSAEQ